MWSIGDRVLANWPLEVSWMYPGVLCGVRDDGCIVQFDDGGRAQVAEEEIRRLNVDVGDRVFGRWRGGGQYLPGKVLVQRGWAILIRYDDGEEEWTSVCLVRIAG